MPHSFVIQILIILSATVLFALAILLLSVYKRLFTGVRIAWLRRNLSVLSVAVVFMLAFLVLQSPDMFAKVNAKAIIGIISKELLKLVIIIVFVYNIVWLISRIPAIKAMSFIKHHAIIILSIVVSAIIIYAAINYVDNLILFAPGWCTLPSIMSNWTGKEN